MKLKIKYFCIIFVLGVLFQGWAQHSVINYNTSSKFNLSQVETLKLDRALKIDDRLEIGINPQFDGLFNKILKQKVENINIKDYFNDYDFGLNIKFNYKLIDELSMSVIYFFGLLEFDVINVGVVDGPNMKICLNYVFK